MIAISKVIQNIVEKGNRIIKVLRFGETDNATPFLFANFGEDFNVPKDYKALFIKTSNSSEPVCIGFLNKVIFDDLNSGDKQLFSTNDAGDSVAAFVKLLNDGTINFNGDSDFVAGYNGLETAINDLNSFLNTELPKIATGISGAGGAYTPGTANIDVSNSKKDNLKTE